MGVTNTLRVLTWIIFFVCLAHYRVLGEEIRCSACQGVAGDPCDVSPWSTVHTVPCSGKCITRRTLYATGRAFRGIWRGCDQTLFPTILGESFRDSCGFGNFFVECTRTCNRPMCNQNHTGIPRGWTCGGDYQSLDLSPPRRCEDPIITTTTPQPPNQMECVSCVGAEGEICDVGAYRVQQSVVCNDTCVTHRQLLASDRSLISVWRGCTDTLFPLVLHAGALDNCDDSDNWFVECTSTCSGEKCNKYITGFTSCWTEEGRRKDSCLGVGARTTTTTTASFRDDLIDTKTNITMTASTHDLPVGTMLNCTSCQGVAGDPCDLSPHEIPHTVSCTGACLTRRALFANGRRLNTIWRGCDQTLFPTILDERFRNTCQYGNFFVECTATCRTGDKCNQNVTGIPQCWSCLGDRRACGIKQEDECENPRPVTTARPAQDMQCISCSGEEGSQCDIRSFQITATTSCNSSCVTRKLLRESDRTMVSVWRGCEDAITLAPGEIGTCVPINEEVSCNAACYDSKCNKYTTGFTECWTTEGRLKPECIGTTTTVSRQIINPSRVTTKKRYSIQDALGGDNYHGEWRPSSVSPSDLDIEEVNTTTMRDRSKYDGPWFGENRRGAANTARLDLLILSAFTCGTIFWLTL